MPRIADEEPVNRPIKEERIIPRRKYRHDILKSQVANAAIHVQNHVGTDIDGVDSARIPDPPGKSKCKVAGPGTDISNNFALLEAERHQDFLRLLVGIPLGILQHLNVRLWILMQPMHLMLVAPDSILRRQHDPNRQEGEFHGVPPVASSRSQTATKRQAG